MKTAAVALALLVAACESRPEAAVDGVQLAQARGVIDEPDGDLIKMTEDAPDPPLPAAGKTVKLAVARRVPWNKLDAWLKRADAAGVKVGLLAGNRWHVRGFVLSDPLSGESIALTGTSDGKICAAPPGEPEAKCYQTIDKDHIDEASTRRLVREAVTEYQLQDVDLQMPPEAQWQDVVRAIDGARTCCGDTSVRVKLNR
ncbi:MAG TPA: hypothetical protein VL172_21215 [Kofleriaceae bacterium]|nr:hypothetical protein [Kofleriaceae bacterium]